MTAAIRTCKTVLGYNARPQWLADAHAVLDAAVAAAYRVGRGDFPGRSVAEPIGAECGGPNGGRMIVEAITAWPETASDRITPRRRENCASLSVCA